jgi:hypothetical protein
MGRVLTATSRIHQSLANTNDRHAKRSLLAVDVVLWMLRYAAPTSKP